MKVSNKNKKLQARIADYNAMKGTPGVNGKWVVVSGGKTQFYHCPGSLKK